MVNLVSALNKSFRGFDLDDAFAYDTQKVVRIRCALLHATIKPNSQDSPRFAQHDARDRRLGLLYYFFWLGILAYVIVSLFYFNRFVETEVL